MTQMIVLAGTGEFTTREGRDACVLTGAHFQAQTRADEPGCLAYYFTADPVVETRMVVFELWADEAALAAHFQHRNYRDMGGHFAKHGWVKGDFKKYRVDLTSAVYDETFTPRADFFTSTP